MRVTLFYLLIWNIFVFADYPVFKAFHLFLCLDLTLMQTKNIKIDNTNVITGDLRS